MKKHIKYFLLFVILFVIHISTEANNYNSFPKATQTNCDTIYLKNGQKIVGQITNYTLFQIKYYDCDDLAAPAVKISRTKVNKIKFANGETKIVSKNSQNSQNNNNLLEYDEFALVGFIVSLIPFFGTVVGFAFSLVGLLRIKRNPKLKGRQLALAGIGISSFYIFLSLLYVFFIIIFSILSLL